MNNKYRRRLFQAGSRYHIFLDRGFSGFIKPHSHRFYQFTVIEKGRITQMHDGVQHSQFRGDAFFTPPGCEHSLFVFDNDTVYYTLSFTEQIFQTAIQAVPAAASVLPSEYSAFFPVNEKEHNQLLQTLAFLMNWPEDREVGTFTCGYHACVIAVMLLFQGGMDHLLARPQEMEMPFDPDRAIYQVLQYLDQHYHEDLKIPDLISMSGLSKTAFFEHFGEVAGITPKQYITEKRMHEALRLIRDTEMPFGVIAEEVGYHDFSTFFRNFHRMSAQSPSEYRMAVQNELSQEEL